LYIWIYQLISYIYGTKQDNYINLEKKFDWRLAVKKDSIMENQKYPLIFIVEDNTVYNKLIANHLRLHKFSRTVSFHSGEECLKNLDQKPDIIIQDYCLMVWRDWCIKSDKKEKSWDWIYIFIWSEWHWTCDKFNEIWCLRLHNQRSVCSEKTYW